MKKGSKPFDVQPVCLLSLEMDSKDVTGEGPTEDNVDPVEVGD